MEFDHDAPAQRVRFATGGARRLLDAEVAELGASRVMVVSGGSAARAASTITAGLPVAVRHDEAVMHVPEHVAERARDLAAEHGVDLLVTVGGGSAVGLGKAVALTTGLPLVAVPTTYAGSEGTEVWGMTTDGVKTTGVDRRVLPRTVIYDAELTLGLPLDTSLASGLNALAHCVDGLWAPRADPINSVMATEAIRAISSALPALADDASALPAREEMLLGSYLAAVAFSSSGSGLHHKICHVLGGLFDLPHAETHAVVLPHVLALNAPHAVQAERRIASALGAGTAVAGLAELYARLGAPTALRDLGMPRDGIAEAVRLVLPLVPASNPAPVTATDLEDLLDAAWSGRSPSDDVRVAQTSTW